MSRLSVIYILFLGLTLMAGCDDKENRVVSSLVSPLGHKFHFMPIREKGVTDVMITVAWPSNWVMTDGNNPMAPYLATQTMAANGSKDLPAADVMALFEDKNSYADIWSSVDYVTAELEFPNNFAGDILPVATPMLQEPLFEDTWIDRTRNGLMENLKAERPLFNRMWSVARRSILGAGPQTTYLDFADAPLLEAVTRDQLIAWHSDLLATKPAAIVVTGGTDSETAGDLVDRLLGAPVQNDVQRTPLQTVNLEAKEIYYLDPDASKVTLGFQGELPPTTDGNDYIDLVIANLFAGGAGSPLFETIRAELGASYGFQAGPANYSRFQRFFFFGGEVEPGKLFQSKEAVRDAYRHFLANPDLSSLETIKASLADEFAESAKYVSSSAGIMRELVLDGQDPANVNRIADLFRNLTEETVIARIAQFPRPDQLMVFGAGPDPAALPGACVVKELADADAC